MKLKFLKEEGLYNLKGNIEENLKHYTEDDNEWILEFFDGNSPFGEFKYDVKDFELCMDNERPDRTDLENIKRVYSNLKFLTESQASDERLWAGLTHDRFWKYMRYRWPVENVNKKTNHIDNQYFFGYSKRRSLVFNGLARLWWVGHYTYDEDRENPFEITEYMSKDLATKALYLFSSNYTSNENIRKGMLGAVVDIEKEGKSIKRQELNEIIKYFNILGGTYLLDTFSKEEIYEKAMRKLRTIVG